MPPSRTRGRTTSRAPKQAAPRNDVYVGLLIISLLAMIAGTVLLYLDYSAYGDSPKDPSTARPAAQAGAPPVAPPPVPAPAPAPMPAPMPMPNP